MEIEDFKPKQPTDTPQLVKDISAEEDATAVKDEVTVEEEPVLTLEGKTISPSELAESLVELKDRAKAAGMRPIQNMVISYINQGLSMVDGLLESLEGSKKKDK
jgi:hypothetical protein